MGTRPNGGTWNGSTRLLHLTSMKRERWRWPQTSTTTEQQLKLHHTSNVECTHTQTTEYQEHELRCPDVLMNGWCASKVAVLRERNRRNPLSHQAAKAA